MPLLWPQCYALPLGTSRTWLLPCAAHACGSLKPLWWLASASCHRSERNTDTQVNSTVDNIGARRLHTVLERTLEEVSFHAPSRVRLFAACSARPHDKTL